MMLLGILLSVSMKSMICLQMQFHNHISGEPGLVSIDKINHVRSDVYNRVGVGVGDDTSFDHCATTGEHDLGAEIIVTHCGRDLSITV
jgi:hypothetical protein